MSKTYEALKEQDEKELYAKVDFEIAEEDYLDSLEDDEPTGYDHCGFDDIIDEYYGLYD